MIIKLSTLGVYTISMQYLLNGLALCMDCWTWTVLCILDCAFLTSTSALKGQYGAHLCSIEFSCVLDVCCGTCEHTKRDVYQL